MALRLCRLPGQGRRFWAQGAAHAEAEALCLTKLDVHFHGWRIGRGWTPIMLRLSSATLSLQNLPFRETTALEAE